MRNFGSMAQNLDSQLRGEFGEEGKGFRRLFNVACAELRESCQLFREEGHCSWWEIDHVQLGALRKYFRIGLAFCSILAVSVAYRALLLVLLLIQD